MTAAFAVGQLVGPYTVTSLGASAATMAVPYVVASAVLLLGALALAHRPAPEPVPVSAREGDRP
jgi:hypothetical protein